MVDTQRWSIWAAAYGGQSNTNGDPSIGTHDRSARTFGLTTGLDYRATPYTVIGFALAGGGTNFGLSDGFGGGHSDMFEAAVYSSTHINSFYVSTALAYARHHATTSRFVTVVGNDNLVADFNANCFGGRVEGGYRSAIPGILNAPGFGLTPYGAFQVQTFHAPSYSEIAASGASTFALHYDARTMNAARSELGSWGDQTYQLDRNHALSFFGRAAWAHDWISQPTLNATFVTLPGSAFTALGALPVKDSLLLTAGSELALRSGWSLMAKFDSELARGSHTYAGTARLRYAW